MSVTRPSRKRNLESAAIYLRTNLDTPRAWGEIATPVGTLHPKDIQVGLRLNDAEGKQVYVDMLDEPRYFEHPKDRPSRFSLTEVGDAWVDGLIARRPGGVA